jgi:hypothetical protein
MTDQPQPTDARVDDVEGHGKRAPFTPADADDVAGHGRNSPIVLDDSAADGDDVTGHGRWAAGVQSGGADDVAGRGRNWLHDQDGPDDVEGHAIRGKA